MSKVRLHIGGRELAARGALNLKPSQKVRHTQLQQLGIDFVAMDTALIGPASSGGYIRKDVLTAWLPGIVREMTQIRTLDEGIGVTTIGKWEDKEIGQRIAGPVGKAELYGDTTNIPLVSYRQGDVRRGVVRFEQGLASGRLEELRQSAEGYNDIEEKRIAVGLSLEMSREYVGWHGLIIQNALSPTYGKLNDPNLPAITGTIDWKNATYQELTAEFRAMIEQIETASGGHVQKNANLTLELPLGYAGVLDVESENSRGRTFGEWIAANYSNTRTLISPELNGANGGTDVAYLYAEAVNNGTDAREATIMQLVPSKIFTVGSENRAKGYIEDSSNATAGVLVTRPWAFARRNVS